VVIVPVVMKADVEVAMAMRPAPWMPRGRAKQFMQSAMEGV